jgi:hypothetical protein
MKRHTALTILFRATIASVNSRRMLEADRAAFSQDLAAMRLSLRLKVI